MNPFYLALGSLFIAALVVLKVTRDQNSQISRYSELVYQAVKQKGGIEVKVELVVPRPLQSALLFTTRYQDVNGQAFMQKVIVVTRGSQKERLFWGDLLVPAND